MEDFTAVYSGTDLTTDYLGLRLANPIVVAPSPLTAVAENVQRMEAAGAGAVVLPSLFEEQVKGTGALETPDMRPYNGGPEKYLEHLDRCRALVKLPLIASLNGSTGGDWLDFAKKLEHSGADAIEFNAYSMASYPIRSGQNMEDGLCRIVHGLASRVKIPIAVKLHPFYTSLPHLASRLVKEGARGFTLFNRFYYPDLDADKMRSDPTLHLSDQSELLLRLRWTAMLSGWLEADIAVTGGVHAPADVVKSLLVGARAVQCASTLLRDGIDQVTVLRDGLQKWMEEHKAVSVKGLIGRAERAERLARETASERASYLEVIRAFKTAA